MQQISIEQLRTAVEGICRAHGGIDTEREPRLDSSGKPTHTNRQFLLARYQRGVTVELVENHTGSSRPRSVRPAITAFVAVRFLNPKRATYLPPGTSRGGQWNIIPPDTSSTLADEESFALLLGELHNRLNHLAHVEKYGAPPEPIQVDFTSGNGGAQ